MSQHQIRLCGGVFLTVLLKSKVERIKGSDGTKINLLEQEVFRRLVSIYQLSDFEPDDLVNFKTYTSQYKTCKKDITFVIKATNSGYQNTFDDDVKSGQSQALLHSAAHSGRWCGGPAAAVRFKQRPKLVSYIRFNHHGVVLCCPL